MVRALAARAMPAGYRPTQQKMDKPLTIQGVGNGFQTCEWEATIPIAVPSVEGDVAVLHHFETPVVKEPGDELPLILDLRSISEKQGILETSS